MRAFDPLRDIENSQVILDAGKWPNFHDAEIHNLNIWRGDVRPDDNIWIGPVIDAKFELCALQRPYLANLRFHDCDFIQLKDFNHQNAVYDLHFEFEARGHLTSGQPLSPCILVRFEQAFGMELSFRCFRVEAIERIEL